MSDNLTRYKRNMARIRPRIRISLLAFVVGWAGVLFTVMRWLVLPSWLFMLCVLLAFAGVAVFLFALNRYGRCPCCHKIPRTRDGRVALHVDRCSHCGERLG